MSGSDLITFTDLKSGKRLERDEIPSLVLATGNFDGVHLGHKALINKAVAVSREMTASGELTESGVFCFRTSPSDLLSDSPPPHICSHEEKLGLFRSLGVRYAVVGDFSRMRDIEFDTFIDFLKSECLCRAIVCGFNFRFGCGGRGSYEDLIKSFGDNAFVIDAVRSEDGIPISSSRIRSMVLCGDVEGAARLLGHFFFLSGKVFHGKALGRRLGLPTVNQNFDDGALIPKKGIYVTSVNIDGRQYAGVTNIGTRPTVENTDRINCETHLLDFDGDLYEKDITVEFRRRLRDEKKFSSEEELRNAIENDVLSAREYFAKNHF
jgi:riboflavin kinase/FMN adenylyltransferase